MITYALARKEQVEKLLLEAHLDPERSKYWALASYLTAPKLEETSWHAIELIAVHGGDVKGYLKAGLDRDSQVVSNLSIVKFCDGHELEFAADLSRILKWLQQHWLAIHWTAADESPYVATYEQLARFGGGSRTGFSPTRIKLRDGRLVGLHRYCIPGHGSDGGIALPPEFAC
jgi:hypothetical protein